MDLTIFFRKMQYCIQSTQSFVLDFVSCHFICNIRCRCGSVFYMIENRFHTMCLGDRDEFIVISVQHDMSVRFQEIKNL